MRTFLTFLACSGFIVWAHSCDKRIVGVQPSPAARETLAVKQEVAKPRPYYVKQRYLKQFFSAAALSVVGNDPQVYLASYRYLRQRNLFSARTDTMMLHFRPRR
ncbi:hypothetical protein [Chitinophaga japonensis]|uniref:Uncharacterized protein n=1 Tax=Chitinophaga japonensis TaxID=104662 RepID=A0A562TFM6_CHIJA|nr:hypothetical protein [Chitinophaga japonensis]TWI91896.1 hypothetical protein LX66_1277 [Chitinophaga japonensis]